MKLSIKSLRGCAMAVTDGDIGAVEEFYFDDESLIRYMIVNSGYWWFGRKVLIPTYAVDHAGWSRKSFPISLTKDATKNSLDIDTEKPVLRQQEAELYKQYGHPNYWSSGAFSVGVWGIKWNSSLNIERVSDSDIKSNKRQDFDLHLRSTRELTGDIENGPECDSLKAVNVMHESRLHDHYGRPHK